MTLDELLDSVQQTSDQFAERLAADGDWSPTLYVYEEEKGLMIAVIDGRLLTDKRRFARELLPNLVRSFTKAPEAVVFLCSAWMVQTQHFPLRVRPSRHPDRVETLMLVGVSSKGETVRLAEIVRGGEHPELEWEPLPEKVAWAGDMMAGVRRSVWG